MFGHVSRPILIVVTLGMFVGAEGFGEVYEFGGCGPQWATVPYCMIATGLIGGLAAAVPGWINWFAILPGTRVKTAGLIHSTAK